MILQSSISNDMIPLYSSKIMGGGAGAGCLNFMYHWIPCIYKTRYLGTIENLVAIGYLSTLGYLGAIGYMGTIGYHT